MTLRAFNTKRPVIGAAVYIDESAVIIGDVILGDDVSIWPTAVLRADVERISIGDGTNIQDGTVLHVSHAGKYSANGHPLTIGKNVTIGHRAVLHACTIGDYCLVGIGAIVMDDAVLDSYVMLGAGALVPPGQQLESGYLYVGSPAKAMRPLTEHEKTYLEYSAQHYVLLKNEYLNAGS
jgi:carbonic anhydrase/acetyltransferase-like protein (isoleucine patch superfamily)